MYLSVSLCIYLFLPLFLYTCISFSSCVCLIVWLPACLSVFLCPLGALPPTHTIGVASLWEAPLVRYIGWFKIRARSGQLRERGKSAPYV